MLLAQISVAIIAYIVIFLAIVLLVDAAIAVVFWIVEQVERWFYDD